MEFLGGNIPPMQMVCIKLLDFKSINSFKAFLITELKKSLGVGPWISYEYPTVSEAPTLHFAHT